MTGEMPASLLGTWDTVCPVVAAGWQGWPQACQQPCLKAAAQNPYGGVCTRVTELQLFGVIPKTLNTGSFIRWNSSLERCGCKYPLWYILPFVLLLCEFNLKDFLQSKHTPLAFVHRGAFMHLILFLWYHSIHQALHKSFLASLFLPTTIMSNSLQIFPSLKCRVNLQAGSCTKISRIWSSCSHDSSHLLLFCQGRLIASSCKLSPWCQKFHWFWCMMGAVVFWEICASEEDMRLQFSFEGSPWTVF